MIQLVEDLATKHAEGDAEGHIAVTEEEMQLLNHQVCIRILLVHLFNKSPYFANIRKRCNRNKVQVKMRKDLQRGNKSASAKLNKKEWRQLKALKMKSANSNLSPMQGAVTSVGRRNSSSRIRTLSYTAKTKGMRESEWK